MTITDDFPGPNIAEEIQLEDRSADGNPTVLGAIRFVNDDIVALLSSGVKSLTEGGVGGGLTENQHENLDTLAHETVENSFEEVTYSGSRPTNVTVWTNASKVLKIREEQFTYSSGRIITAVFIQYDGSGVESYRITENYAYSGGKIVSMSRVRA